MDFNPTQGYKTSTLFFNLNDCLICVVPKEYEMDKEFLRLIDNVNELIPRPTEKLDDEVLICECFCVSVSDIRELCKTRVDLDLLEGQMNLGRGCRSCLKQKDDWVNKIF
jgi:NAD(P)H-nitrite reductase large subunit